MSEQRLEANGICVEFDGVRALHEATVEVRRGEIMGLIGPNGAGKTTLVNAISGYQNFSRGRVTIDGVDASSWTAPARARGGVVRTFQAVRVFRELTVRENIELGAIGVGSSSASGTALADELMEMLDLHSQADVAAGNLSYGYQRRLGIARSLAAKPQYLLLDEPAAGLSEEESVVMSHVLRDIRDEFGCGMLLIEHDMPLVMGICDRITVLNFGEILATGTPAEIRNNRSVVEAYLGSEVTNA
ncbi:ABC transporter ATP-binding protein [Ruicaihuangia caeni]|uniref:ABC transporter ATP-binding protein n=1 Tax=Ruicaihuangia caeni TaxID=3042517 RepID=A0AAW6T5I8_9MICO|nr:ABC transporter ATP-binding protein [Klugiella sp. YN-L-19]MDI2099096.1 ABC transporter ATP-binding protein [Klugiella sp. YN-L-19]